MLDDFDPIFLAKENEDEIAIKVGYRSSDFYWFGKSVPDTILMQCLMCDCEMRWTRELFFKKKIFPENCSQCRRKSLMIYDKDKWERYIAFELWNFSFFLDQFSTPFVIYQPKDVRRIFPLRSEDMRAILSTMTKSRTMIENALVAMEGMAHKMKIEYHLEARVAKNGTGIYVDLCNDKWQAVKITRDGIDLVEKPPIIFRRYKHMQSLEIERGTKEDLDAFVGLMNLASHDDILLYIGYLAALFVPEIDHPILMPVGPQGSAKTTLTVASRMVIDPSVLTTMNMTDEKSLPQILMHHYLPSFDNCGYISQEISDILCRVVTGAGFSKRRLYTDDDDVVYMLRRPVILNGISPPSMSPDLTDRTILIALERIPDNYRQEKKIIEAKRDALLPKVRGYLMQVVSDAMKLSPSEPTCGLPRLADFSRVADACCVVMGYQPEEFIKTYIQANKEIAEVAVQSDPIIAVLLEFLAETGEKFDGTASTLYKNLEVKAGATAKSKQWPSNPQRLSDALTGRLKPGLAIMGYNVFRKKGTGGMRSICIEKSSGELKLSS